MTTPAPTDVDAYIAAAPKSARPMLRQLRRLIKATVPKAQEKISYGIPFYEHHGRLVYFAGYEHHVGLYAAIPEKNAYQRQWKKYLAAKATLQFPIGDPLPVALIAKLLQARVRENEAKK